MIKLLRTGTVMDLKAYDAHTDLGLKKLPKLE